MKQEITINDVKGIWIPLDEIQSITEVKAQQEPVKSKLQEAREKYPAGTKVKGMVKNTEILTIRLDDIDDLESISNIYLSCVRNGKNERVMVYDSETNIWAEILPNFPTMDDIYDSVQPKYFATNEGLIADVEYEKGQHNDFDLLPTYEDAAQSIAYRTLVVIAAYYNSMFQDEKKDNRFYATKEEKIFHNGTLHDLIYGEVLFTLSAAKEALKNPNVVEVLNKYFRIK